MRSREKLQTKETLESNDEEVEPLTKKGIKPIKFIKEMEAAREKDARKRSSLDLLVINTQPRKQLLGDEEEKRITKFTPTRKE